MPDVTPERLAEIEDEIRNFPPPTWTAGLMVPDPCAALRAAWGERDAAVARADENAILREEAEWAAMAAAQEAATLREALVPFGAMVVRKARDVLATPPTVHARLAQARSEIVEADKALTDAELEENDAAFQAAIKRVGAAWDALAKAEEAAGVKGDG